VDDRGEIDLSGDLSIEKESVKPMVLIVEDNGDLRKYISGILGDVYHLREAENGKTGLEMAVETIPDLILTDLMMPEMDGMEFCNRVKADQRTSHIPVIMLTAKADKESKLEGLKTGADDYLVKPFDADELLVRVENLIRQRNHLREAFRKEFISSDPFTKDIPHTEKEFIPRIIECILNHLEDYQFGVENLADEIGFSRSQLHRKLRSVTGYGPSRFITNVKLKQAARMLREGNHNITRVLYSVGFQSPSYFSKCFRELYGLNPSEYIRLEN
jgi:YesN/AraC family two-component response regulator